MELAELRLHINETDTALLSLLERRMKLCAEVADYKRAHGLPTFDAAREAQVIARARTAVAPELADYAEQLMTALMSMSRAYQHDLRANANLVLIGMPGAGKTSVGRLVAGLLSRPFLDMDEELEREAGMDIPTIFRLEGETCFRDRESRVAKRLSDRRGVVIAAGGGTVCRPENTEALSQNGVLIELRRPLDCLATEGRPLSLSRAALEELWRTRKPLYEAAATYQVENCSTLEEAARAVSACFQNDMEKEGER